MKVVKAIFSPFFWKVSHFRGCNRYEYNLLTGKRRVVPASSGYSPVDTQWLDGKPE